MTQTESESLPKRRRPSKDTLNLVVAGCAVLISAASFVATYVQSEAALRQVKAETWPILQLEHGNTNSEGEREISMYLQNVGVGPASVKSFHLELKGTDVFNANSLPKLIYDEEVGAKEAQNFLTEVISPRTISDGSQKLVFALRQTDKNLGLWATLNKVRWQLSAEACYCSLLDECFETDFVSTPVEVDACLGDTKSFNGG